MKTIKTFAFAVLALAMTFATTSCSKDDAGTANVSTTKIETSSQSQSQQSQKETQKETAKANNTLSFSYVLSEDMFNLFDMTITYTDANGEQKTETIKQEDGKLGTDSMGTMTTNVYTFTKQITYTKMPLSNISYKIGIQNKTTPLAQKDRYSFVGKLAETSNIASAKACACRIFGVKYNSDKWGATLQAAFDMNSATYNLSTDGQLIKVSTRGRIFY